MYSDLFILVTSILSIFSLGYCVYILLFGRLPLNFHGLIKIGFYWILGNLVLIAILHVLALTNTFSMLKPSIVYGISAITILSAAFITYRRRNEIKFKTVLGNVCVLIIISLFFYPIIRYSLFSYVYEWDSVAIWFLKAKAIFYSQGLMHNPYFNAQDAFLYSNKAYPVGIPLVMAAYYTLIHSVNDQVIKFYDAVYFLLLTGMLYGLVKWFFPRSNMLVALMVSLGFYAVPHYLNYAVNGYIDVAIALSFGLSMAVFVRFLQEKDITIKINIALLQLLITGCAATMKLEGVAWFILFNTISLIILAGRLRKKTFEITPSLAFKIIGVFILSVFSMVLWKYYLILHHIPLYFDVPVLQPDLFARFKMIMYQYLDELTNTSNFGITLIPVFCTVILQVTYLMKNRFYQTLIPFTMLMVILAITTVTYIITPLSIDEQLQSSFPRLLLQISPSFLVVIIFQMQKTFEGKKQLER